LKCSRVPAANTQPSGSPQCQDQAPTSAQPRPGVNQHPRQWKPSAETDLSSITRASRLPQGRRREEFLYILKTGPAGGRLGGRPRAGNDTTVAVNPVHPAAPWSPPRGGATRSSDSDGVWAGSNLRLRRQLPMRARCQPAGWPGRRGRRPRPRPACGGPAGCWRRGRQHAEGGPGLKGLVRPLAPARPRSGR
jgi:hypothetical protein